MMMMMINKDITTSRRVDHTRDANIAAGCGRTRKRHDFLAFASFCVCVFFWLVGSEYILLG